MATLGTFVAGQVLTAAELNAIGTWQTWTPTITAATGTITTSTVYRAEYVRINKLVIAHINVFINNAGTGLGLRWSLPVASAQSGGEAGYGRENFSTGISLNMQLVNSTTVAVNGYDNRNVCVTNYETLGTFIYEAA